MKRAALLTLFLLPATSLAGDGFLGTKTGGGSSFHAAPPSSIGGEAVVQLFVALALVLLLIRYILPKALTKFNRRLTTKLSGGISIEESASFAGGNLYVVNARSKSLLISVTGTSVTCLADLTELPAQAEEPKTFQEMLDEAPGEAPNPDAFAETLARLDRLDKLTQS